MLQRVYYNEIDPGAAAWLRELIKAGAIPDGTVDTRSITLVAPEDLQGFTQCHFFAGIGGWSYALQLAGWDASQPVWTGSCPCQPFSTAGAGKGGRDPRHLWPVWFNLIRQCRPPVVFGEQVEAAIAHGWLDLVHADLEGEGYACGWAGLPAASVGAPHIRGRVWFVADTGREPDERRGGSGAARRAGGEAQGAEDQRERRGVAAGAGGSPRVMVHPPGSGRAQGRGLDGGAQRTWDGSPHAGIMGHPDHPRPQGRGLLGATGGGDGAGERTAGPSGSDGPGFWDSCAWLPCIDGKSRPVESLPEQIPDGLSADLGRVRLVSHPDRPHAERVIYAPLIQKGKARVMRLRGYGNAIVGQVAAEFIRAYLEC